MPVLLFLFLCFILAIIISPSFREKISGCKSYIFIIAVLFLAFVLLMRGQVIPAMLVSIGAMLLSLARSVVFGLMVNRIIRFFSSPKSRKKQKDSTSSAMEITEALEIMDLGEDYTEEQLLKQYHHLMKRYHPDQQQGSKYMAKKINAAKELLLQWHHSGKK